MYTIKKHTYGRVCRFTLHHFGFVFPGGLQHAAEPVGWMLSDEVTP